MAERCSRHHGEGHRADRADGQRVQCGRIRQERHQAIEAEKEKTECKPEIAEVENPKKGLAPSRKPTPACQPHSKSDTGREFEIGSDGSLWRNHPAEKCHRRYR